jgi:hypothetical protein
MESAMKVGRNDPCPCNSGKKHKQCCGVKGTPTHRMWNTALILVLVILLGGGAVAIYTAATDEPVAPAGKVWSEEHGHWHDAPVPTAASLPPGPPPPGKVWSPEHGHWHDAPDPDDPNATETEPADDSVDP